jgi:hypothetical protein
MDKRCSVADWLPRGCDERDKNELFRRAHCCANNSIENGTRDFPWPRRLTHKGAGSVKARDGGDGAMYAA